MGIYSVYQVVYVYFVCVSYARYYYWFEPEFCLYSSDLEGKLYLCHAVIENFFSFEPCISKNTIEHTRSTNIEHSCKPFTLFILMLLCTCSWCWAPSPVSSFCPVCARTGDMTADPPQPPPLPVRSEVQTPSKI
jgi:hypothetical protein